MEGGLSAGPLHGDGFERFVMVSLALHVLVIGAVVVWAQSFRAPELTLAQGMVSLQVIDVPPGMEGTAASPGEGASPVAKAEPVHEKEAPAVEPNQPLNAQVETADETEQPPQDPPVVVAAVPPAKHVEETPVAPGETQGKHPAQAGSAAPSVAQPGTPGGVAATALRNPTPPYPEDARRDGVEGIVILRLNIDEAGKVKQAAVVKSSGRGDFDHAAVDTIERRWRYRPALSWGRPVESTETVRICFVLGNV